MTSSPRANEFISSIFSSFAKDGSDIASYVPHTYDATYALAHALHTLIYDMGISTFTGDELGQVLQFNTSFQGVTGLVSFRYGDPATGYGFGDRLHDFSFNVVNYRKSSSTSSSGGSLQSVGLWTEGKGFKQCVSQSCLFEFSTTDGTIPIDTPLPVVQLMLLGVRAMLASMSAICLAVVIGLTVFKVKHRNKKRIKAAQKAAKAHHEANAKKGKVRNLKPATAADSIRNPTDVLVRSRTRAAAP